MTSLHNSADCCWYNLAFLVSPKGTKAKSKFDFCKSTSSACAAHRPIGLNVWSCKAKLTNVNINTPCITGKSTQSVQTSARLPSWILSEVIIILCRNYFCGLRINKFGENILKRDRAVARGGCSVRRFWPSTLTLTSAKLTVTFGTDSERLCQISWKSDFYYYFSRMNVRTNQQTNTPDRNISWFR